MGSVGTRKAAPPPTFGQSGCVEAAPGQKPRARRCSIDRVARAKARISAVLRSLRRPSATVLPGVFDHVRAPAPVRLGSPAPPSADSPPRHRRRPKSYTDLADAPLSLTLHVSEGCEAHAWIQKN